MSESPALVELRRRIARLDGGGGVQDRQASWLGTGHAPFDEVLGGGFMAGRTHEFFSADVLDATSAAAFAALVALRVPDAPLVWLRSADAPGRVGYIHAPGIAALGGDPDRLLLIEAPDPRALLACANDAIRSAGSAAVILESWGAFPALDLTAGRRFALGARDAGTTLMLLRLDAAPSPSVAETRWRVAAAPSRALEANAPGAPAFDLELLRWRAGPAGGHWRLDWNHDDKSFGHALGASALSGTVLPLAARRAGVSHGAAAA